MFWIIYIIGSICFSFLLSFLINKSSSFFFILLVVLLTPAQIEISSDAYAPAIFSFFYNVILEKDYSLRVLRPIVLTLSLSLVVLLILNLIKRRFF